MTITIEYNRIFVAILQYNILRYCILQYNILQYCILQYNILQYAIYDNDAIQYIAKTMQHFPIILPPPPAYRLMITWLWWHKCVGKCNVWCYY